MFLNSPPPSNNFLSVLKFSSLSRIAYWRISLSGFLFFLPDRVSYASWLVVVVWSVTRDWKSPESRLPVGQSRLTGVPLVGLCTQRAGGTECKKKQRIVVLFVVPCSVEKWVIDVAHWLATSSLLLCGHFWLVRGRLIWVDSVDPSLYSYIHTQVWWVDSNLSLRLRTILYCFFLAIAAVYVWEITEHWFKPIVSLKSGSTESVETVRVG